MGFAWSGDGAYFGLLRYVPLAEAVASFVAAVEFAKQEEFIVSNIQNQVATHLAAIKQAADEATAAAPDPDYRETRLKSERFRRAVVTRRPRPPKSKTKG